ncbi:hypothetical protein [Pseudomonas sp. CFBP 13719]|uniref:hypothetical protein n=1 Tax=Pseudomonas sp. CFBP 13719 TaxID=2775303 RepID=UPI0017838092|nr:hypothetical protein [Pseudomonas sp. CFBP 13719]MBD8680344.1 hypothetical protein [Pseudomonas sp. CFBP 13719]
MIILDGTDMRRFRFWCEETTDWWAAQKVEWYAAHGTVIYIGIIILVVAAKLDELLQLKLNELGDFLAGAFGPVAFLWLVLGFLQQGRELKLSSDALRLQAEEVAKSVKQQASLAEAQQRSLENYERSLEPLLQLEYLGPTNYLEVGDVLVAERFLLENKGSYCEHVFAQALIKDEEVVSVRLSPLSKGESKEFMLKDVFPIHEDCEIQIHYTKSSGLSGRQSFFVYRYPVENKTRIQIIKRTFENSMPGVPPVFFPS